MTSRSPTSIETRALLARVDEVVRQIERSHQEELPIRAIASAIVRELCDDLGIYGGRLYERDGEDYRLVCTFPDAREIEGEVRVPRTYEPIELTLMRGVLYMDPNDPRLDQEFERRIGVDEFAAIEAGNERYIFGFNVAPGHSAETVVSSLGVVRHAINQKIREQEIESILHQAKLIQNSILPPGAPDHDVFDLAARMDSLENVGGDLFDFIPIHDRILGVTVADASGHGLPAALQVRDVYIGLRMGLERDLKIIRTIERLNRIIYGSTLSSRFVSLFYAELENSGLLIYVNAGHPPALHFEASTGRIRPLREGGPILGPLPDATYDRGFVHLDPGDVVVLYSDGITETKGETTDDDEDYGRDRLEQVVAGHRDRPAAEIVEAIFDDVERFAAGRPTTDDRTVIVIRRPIESETRS
ncbi:MAG: PP2C family protein-serine/threonine phosphatase [Acidobacteriota bacterium]